MWMYILAILVVLAVAAMLAGVVVVGMEGRYRDRAPKVAHRLARLAQHANGDGELPPEVTKRLQQIQQSRLVHR